MAIYLEARNVSGAGGVLGGHMYLVYIPEGEENNPNAWKTIGAFPELNSIEGPWGDLGATNLDASIFNSSLDSYPVFPESLTPEELSVMTQSGPVAL